MIHANTKLLGIMPVIGLGTWDLRGQKCVESVKVALELGYRHIDTAQMYKNETEVGKGIQLSSIARDKIFSTTKIDIHNLKPALIKQSTIESYLGRNLYRNHELDFWKQKMEQRQRWFTKKGIAFLFLIVPNKHTIYSEYLPGYLGA